MYVVKVALREYVPLKQGLRQVRVTSILGYLTPPRVCSTYTMIKTSAICHEEATRVLREYVPLKQGLRR